MEIIARYRQRFESHLQANQPNRKPESPYEPVKYILDLGGKRLRPVFVLMGCGAWSDKPQKALNAAMAVELFHNFTLLHDDIMDEAGLRRGKPTVNKKYGINAGILSGDVMMIMAYQQILDIGDPSLIKPLLDIFNKMAFEVCEGQQMDMDFEKLSNVSITEYLEMITLKTSVLIGAAIRMGALIGGADTTDQDHIYEFGKNYGLAFQLQDDFYLDFYFLCDGKQKLMFFQFGLIDVFLVEFITECKIGLGVILIFGMVLIFICRTFALFCGICLMFFSRSCGFEG